MTARPDRPRRGSPIRGRSRPARLTAGALLLAMAAAASSCASAGAALPPPPKVLTLGTLYASVGQFAASSQAQFAGLQFWVHQVNAAGGVLVGAYRKRIPVKIVAYDDQSSTSLAQQEYQQLITDDHVAVVVSDFGSVLTSVGVPIAQENGVLLFDPTATTPSFFTESIFGNGNPDLVLTSLPSSAVWPTTLAQFLLGRHVQRVAIIQAANDFDAAQATTLESTLATAGIVPVMNDIVQTSTTDYAAAVAQAAAANADAVVELGYASNDVGFLQALGNSGWRPPITFTIFPGEALATFAGEVPASVLDGTYTYQAPPLLGVSPVNLGMSSADFVRSFGAEHPGPVGFLDIAGYQAGLVIQATLADATGLSPLDQRVAAQRLSGRIHTLEGDFRLDANGSQIGLEQPVAQIADGPGGISAQVVPVPSAAGGSGAVGG